MQIFSFSRIELQNYENITSLKNCPEKFFQDSDTKQVSPQREIQAIFSNYFCNIFAKIFAIFFCLCCESCVFKKEFSVPTLIQIRVILICRVAYCVNSTSLTFHFILVAQLKPVLVRGTDPATDPDPSIIKQK